MCFKCKVHLFSVKEDNRLLFSDIKCQNFTGSSQKVMSSFFCFFFTFLKSEKKKKKKKERDEHLIRTDSIKIVSITKKKKKRKENEIEKQIKRKSN